MEHRNRLSRRQVVAGASSVGLGLVVGLGGRVDGVLAGPRPADAGLWRANAQDALPPAVRARLLPAMREAVAEARQAYYAFGAVLLDVATGQTVYRAHNTGATGDPTAHAEVNVLRGAGLAGLDLTRTVLVTSAESCPMCAAAEVWANVAGVVYGSSIADLIAWGWRQIDLPSADVLARSMFNNIPLVGPVLTDETDPLYNQGQPPPPPKSA